MCINFIHIPIFICCLFAICQKQRMSLNWDLSLFQRRENKMGVSVRIEPRASRKFIVNFQLVSFKEASSVAPVAIY